MNWSEDDLKNYLSKPEINHLVYGSEKKLWEILKKFYKSSKQIRSLIKKI